MVFRTAFNPSKIVEVSLNDVIRKRARITIEPIHAENMQMTPNVLQRVGLTLCVLVGLIIGLGAPHSGQSPSLS